MHICRECGKPVEATAQFCPWCFALPGTAADSRARSEPVAAAATQSPWIAAPVQSSPWPRIMVIGGGAAFATAVAVALFGRL